MTTTIDNATKTSTTTIHISASHPAVELARKAFPTFRGKLFRVTVTNAPFNFESYWDSGDRDYHQIIRLSDMAIVPVPQNGTPFDRKQFVERPIEPGFAVVTLACRGRSNDYITISVHPDNAGHLALPAPTELSADEKTVLIATRSFKSSYAGVSNYRFIEAKRTTGITIERWESAKSALIGRKLLNAAGAITVDGRNAIGRERM